MNPRRSLPLLFALLSLAPASSLHAAALPEAAAGRALVKNHADAIIGIELVATVKIKQGDREMPPREQRIEVNGTVISASGLTVTSLAAVDPQSTIEAMRAAAPAGFRGELVGVDFKEVKLRLANGTEVPARFVLKDADLDLAFMAPVADAPAAQSEFAHVKLGNAVEGEVLNRYFYVSRAIKSLQRTPLVRATEVTGIVEKPRRFYLMTDSSLGTPVLDVEGRLLGITVQHFANGRPAGLVALPAADVAEIAKQAAEAQAKPPEPAPTPTPPN